MIGDITRQAMNLKDSHKKDIVAFREIIIPSSHQRFKW